MIAGIHAQEAAAVGYRRISQAALRGTLSARTAQGAFEGVNTTLTGLFAAAVIVAAAVLAFTGQISIGALIAAAGIAQVLLDPLQSLIGQAGSLWAVAMASARRVLDVLGAGERADRQGRDIPDPRGEPVVEITTPEADAPVRVDAGEFVVLDLDAATQAAVIDALTLHGAHDRDDPAGRVRLHGAALSDLDPVLVREQLLVAPHHVDLFEGSVLDNVVVACEGSATGARAALTVAHCDGLQQELLEGYDSPVGGDGRSLSGGQRQRVALARALAAGRSVLVLHEPTNAVDSVTETEIARRVRQARSGSTTIVPSVLPQFASAVFTLALAVAGMAVIDGRFALVLLVVIPLYVLSLRWYLRTAPPVYAAERAAESTRSQHVLDTVTALPTVSAYRMQDRRRDLTFSVPKSVSTLWAVADGGVQALIAQAHHAAINDVLELIEQDVAMTRVGAAGPRGAVAQVDIRGLVATAYDHFDSRTGGPQLHTHVVVANRVQAVQDGKWRTLDSRALHAAVAGLSEHYNAVLSDRLTAAIGVGWEGRARGADRMTRWEIRGVPQELMDDFSSRTQDIEETKERLVAAYVDAHGRRPSARQLWRIRQQATLETRPDKELHALSELTARWRERVAARLDEDPPSWASHLLQDSTADVLLRADDVRLEDLAELAQVVVAEVGNRRATWRRWNLHAEAVRQTMSLRFASPEDRRAIVGLLTDLAESVSLRLTPPELASSLPVFQRGDGTSVFRPKASTVYSSAMVLAAEDRLLDAGEARTAPGVLLGYIEEAAKGSRSRPRLSPDQEAAIAQVAVSNRVVDVLVGPAGTGKTTTMSALRHAWERQHGRGSVIGLAPSAAAAEVLAGDLGVTTENTAKWLFEHRNGNWALTAGQLVIIDEASLAGTLSLDAITTHARQVGAKVLLVGDWAQLAAVDTGGAFSMLVAARDQVPELTDVRRFRNEWEKAASLGLRIGDTSVIDTYLAQQRVHGAAYDDILDAAYQTWKTDLARGKSSVLIAETRETVSVLNERARTDRIIAGSVDPEGVRLADGNEASRGDVVISRRNDRYLHLGRSWVKNGDRWIITQTNPDGSVRVCRQNSKWRTTLTLPASYVATDLELGYPRCPKHTHL